MTISEKMSLADPRLWAGVAGREELARLRADAPLSWHEEPRTEWFPQGGRGFWSLVRYDDVVAASRDQDTFSSEHGTEIVDMTPTMAHVFGGMLNMSGDSHALHRGIVNRVLTPRTIRGLAGPIRAHAVRSLERVEHRPVADFMQDIVGDFPAQVICDLFGVPDNDRAELIRLTGQALTAYGTATSYDAVLEIVEYAEGLVARHRSAGTGATFLDRLLDADIDGARLSIHEVGVFFALLITAGIETTTSAIGVGMHGLSLFPAQRRAWQADYDALAPVAIEEIVRWASPVMHFRRTATRDVDLHGQRIAAGDKVVLWYVSANRDEQVFDNPEDLDFGRPHRQHVGFGGGGPHFCLGAGLARQEMTIFFDELFRRYPGIEVDGEPVRLHSNFVHGYVSLPVRLAVA